MIAKSIKIIALVGAFSLGFANVNAYAEVAQTTSLKTQLTLNECLTLAYANDIDLKTIDTKIILAERELSEAKVNASNAAPERTMSEAQYLEEGKKLDLYPAIKEKALNDLKDSREDTKRGINKSVVAAFQSINDKRATITQQTKALAILEKELAIKKTEFNLGKTTAISLLDYETSIQESKIQLAKANSDLLLAQITLNKKIGYPLTVNTQVVGSLVTTVTKPNEDIEALAKLAKENLDSVKDAKYTYEQALKEMEIINKYTIYNRSSSYESLEDKIPDYKKAYEQAIIEAEINLKSDYINLQNAYNDIEVAKLKIKIAELNLATEQAKLKVGKTTNLAVVKLQNELDTKNQAVNAAIVKFYQLKLDFDATVEKIK